MLFEKWIFKYRQVSPKILKFLNNIHPTTFLIIIVIILLLITSQALAAVPDWVKVARIAGTDISADMSDTELNNLLNQRLSENVSVLEFDSRLSEYLSDSEFDQEVTFLNHAAQLAHDIGLQSVIYYPSLEVITQNGENIPNTMFKDHPDWIQYGLNGEPNVFYGSKEHWVDPNAESAWMSPNSPYREYYLNRIRKLAATSLDGVWVDVPIYLDTGTDWAGAGSYAATDFRAWSITNGLGGSEGYNMPSLPNFNDPVFRAWVRWRHENLATFLEDIRLAAHEVNPEFMIVIENFPMDYMDATKAGLDGTFRLSGDNFIRVWEVDSVSNTRGMQWSNFEDFSNKISMFKWANSVEHENPAWVFSYGGESLDASLVLAAAVAAGNAPFEAQTPNMTETVDSAMRTRWFDFLRNNQSVLLNNRNASVGIWYSAASRDYQDFSAGGEYGMYSTTTLPASDPDWWSTEFEDSVINKPHLGGYRGAAYGLTQLNLPYNIVADPGQPEIDLAEKSLLWLPSVAAISNASVSIIEEFVAAGGIVLATGEIPGRLDEMGNQRPTNAFNNLFSFPIGLPVPVQNPFGNGLAIYRPDIRGRDLFGEAGDPLVAEATLNKVESVLLNYVTKEVEISSPSGIHVELSQVSQNSHHLYLVNYSGLQLPLISAPKTITVRYRAPLGFNVVSADVASPDIGAHQGALTVTHESDGRFKFDTTVDQFNLIRLSLLATEPGENNPPIANVDNLTTDENITINFTSAGLIANDTDIDGDTLSLILIADVSKQGGLITDTGSGTYSFTPPSGFTGTDSFNYTIIDGAGGEATGTVFITINSGPEPLPTVYYPDLITITDGSFDFGTLTSFIESDADTYDILSQADGDLQVVDWYASATIMNPASSITDLKVTYKGQYSVSAVSQSFYLYNFSSTSWDFFDNRNVGNTDDITISINITSNIQHYISATGEIRSRIRGEKASGEFFVWANFLNWEIMDTTENNPPIANDNTLNIFRDTAVTISANFLLANDTDADGDMLIINSIANISDQGGTIIDNNNGTYLYLPPSAFIGIDTFSYQITDARGGTDSATVVITINEPTNTIPVASNDTLTTSFNAPIDFTSDFLLSNDTDADGDTLVLQNLASNSLQGGTISDLGSGNFRYTPPTNFVGQDSFNYEISDNHNATDSGLVIINVSGPENNAPIANDNNYTILQGNNIVLSTAALLANDSDPDGDNLSLVTIDTSSQAGFNIVSLGNDLYRYTPAPIFFGVDTFNYSISDGKGGNDTAQVTILVLEKENSPPVANNDVLDTTQDLSINFTANFLLANDTDPDGDTLTVSDISLTSLVGASISNLGDGNYRYIPLTGFNGIDSFSYQISDGNGATSNATVTINVNPLPNSTPIANDDQATTNQDSALVLSISQLLENDNDPDGDSLTLSNVSPNSQMGGVIIRNDDNTITYTPPQAYVGPDSFSYEISDGNGGVDTALVNVNVTENLPPLENEIRYPTNISIDTGTYDWGTLTSFLAQDNDTYDIRSIAIGDGQLVDWIASTKISGPIDQMEELHVTYQGQYSRRNVSQTVYLFNYQLQIWQQFSNRIVGNTDDVTISINIENNPQNYVSRAGNMRLRIQGYRSSRRFFVWANFISWAVKYNNENSVDFDDDTDNLSSSENESQIEFLNNDEISEEDNQNSEQQDEDDDGDGDNENEDEGNRQERGDQLASAVIITDTDSSSNNKNKTGAASIGLIETFFILLFSLGILFRLNSDNNSQTSKAD